MGKEKCRSAMIDDMVSQLAEWSADSLLELAQDMVRRDYGAMTDERLKKAYRDFLEYHPEYGEEG